MENNNGDWRAQLQSEARQEVVNNIMETLNRHIPFYGQQELKKIAVRFEEKIYAAAISHTDYLQKISLKVLSLGCKYETKQPDRGAFMNTLMANLPSQGQQSRPQHAQQQFMLQIQSLSAQLQQQMNLQELSNPLQRDLQQRHQASGQAPGSMFQAQNVMDQQEQLHQSQSAIQETPSMEIGHADGGECQEEAYQKLKQMKEMYFPELNEMYQKMAAYLQQHDSLPQQPKSEQLEKLKIFKSMLERIMSILQMSKSNIQPGFKEKLGSYEKQIINFINTNRPRRPIPPMQQGQLSQPHLQSTQQSQSQIPQVQSHDTQMNPQLQTMNMQGSVSGMQQNNMSSLQQVSSMSSAPTPLQNTMHQLQSGSYMDFEEGN